MSADPIDWNVFPDERRDGEPFTATVDCPRCEIMAVHWLEAPRLRPDPSDRSPLARATSSVATLSEYVSAVTLGGRPRFYDPSGTVVARICRGCGYRWGQR